MIGSTYRKNFADFWNLPLLMVGTDFNYLLRYQKLLLSYTRLIATDKEKNL